MKWKFQTFILWFSILTFLSCVAWTSSTTLGAPPSAPPNIVLILADDLGIGDAGCYNQQSKIPTPQLDKLAQQGIRFIDAHSPSSVCSPTRYGLLTGRYAWRSRLKRGVLWGYSRSLIEPGRMTIASLLKQHGYATACVGKWHLGFQSPDLAAKNLPRASAVLKKSHPQAVDYDQPLRPGPTTFGFDYFFGIPASLDMEPYVYVENDRVVQPPTEMVEKSLHRRQKGGGFWRGGPIAPGFKHQEVLPRITEKAVAWLERQNASKPFFLYFPLTAPHTPWLPTSEFRGKSQAGYYGDFVAQVDAVVGQIDAVLQRKSLADDTLLIVTSDNGSHWPPADIKKWGHAANLQYRGQKADIWEGGHRVPFLARWPGRIDPSGVSGQTICLTDLLATVADIVGAKLAEGAGEDSFSFLPDLVGKKRPAKRPPVIHHSVNGTFAIRRDQWKLIVGNLGSGGFSPPQVVKPQAGDPQGQLYDLEQDPGEQNNLYKKEKQAATELAALLKSIRDGRLGGK